MKLDAKGRAFLTIPVLEFMNGRAWDDDAVGMLYALRPSDVRVVPVGQPTNDDARVWRVTVYVDDFSIGRTKIIRVEQEVEFGAHGMPITGSEVRRRMGLSR